MLDLSVRCKNPEKVRELTASCRTSLHTQPSCPVAAIRSARSSGRAFVSCGIRSSIGADSQASPIHPVLHTLISLSLLLARDGQTHLVVRQIVRRDLVDDHRERPCPDHRDAEIL